MGDGVSHSVVSDSLFVTSWTAARQTPLSMEFSRQEYSSGSPFPSPGNLPHPGIEPRSPALQADSFFFYNLFFYWRIIALQNFVVFCQASTWISHRYTYIPYLLNLPPIPSPSHLLGWYRAPVWVSWDMQQIPGGHLFHIWWCKLPCFSFHTSHPILPSPPSVSLFSMSVSPLLPCK